MLLNSLNGKYQMKADFAILLILFTLGIQPVARAVQYYDFPTELQQVLDDRAIELEEKGGICIAGKVIMSDGARIQGGKDVQINLLHAIDAPAWVYEDGWFIMKRIHKSYYAGPGARIVLRAFGYEPIDASETILDGQITYFDFEMIKIPDENLAAVKGIVMDEDNYIFPGAAVSLSFPLANHGTRNKPMMNMYTNSNGEYSFSGLSCSEYSLTASADEYAYHNLRFTPSPGETSIRDLQLFPNRRITIDYIYQADGSRSFTDGQLQTGTLDWLHSKGGVDFSQARIEGYDSNDLRDLELQQTNDVLSFRNFYVNGKNGFYDVGAVDFNSVTEAPDGVYSSAEKRCQVGHTYIVRTYELNYAKFIVKTNESSFRTVGPYDLKPMEFSTYGLNVDFAKYSDYSRLYVRKYFNSPPGLLSPSLPYYLELSGLDGLRYSANLTFTYDDNDVLMARFVEGRLAIYKSAYNGASWQKLQTKIDTANNTLKVQGIASLGLFAIASDN